MTFTPIALTDRRRRNAPTWIRTRGLLLRREPLYPAELSGLGLQKIRRRHGGVRKTPIGSRYDACARATALARLPLPARALLVVFVERLTSDLFAAAVVAGDLEHVATEVVRRQQCEAVINQLALIDA